MLEDPWWWTSIQELGAASSWQPAGMCAIIFNTARKINSTNNLRGALKVFSSLSPLESPCEMQPGWYVCETMLSCVQNPDSTMWLKKKKCILSVLLILFITPIVLLYITEALFVEPRVGKPWTKRLEEDLRSCRNCRHVYSLLTGIAAIAADII